MATTLKRERNLLVKNKDTFRNYISDIILQCPVTVKPVLVVFKDIKTNTVLKTTCTTDAHRRISDLLHWWLEAMDNGNTPAHVNKHVQCDKGVLAYLQHKDFNFADLGIIIMDNDGYTEFETIDDAKQHQENFEQKYPTVRNLYNDFIDSLRVTDLGTRLDNYMHVIDYDIK